MSLVRLQWYVCSCQNIKKGVCGFAVEASFLYQEGKKRPWLKLERAVGRPSRHFGTNFVLFRPSGPKFRSILTILVPSCAKIRAPLSNLKIA